MELNPSEREDLKRQMEQEMKNAVKEYSTGEARKCLTCRKSFPLTPNNFHRDSNDDSGFKKSCKQCRAKIAQEARDRQIVRNADSVKQKAEEVLGGATSFLDVTSQAAAKNNVPHLAELYEQMMFTFGGSDGMAAKYLETFEQAPQGGQVRKGILDTIVKTGEKVSEMGVAQVPVELIADEDLSKEVQQRLKLILGKDAHLVDYLMGKKDRGAIESATEDSVVDFGEDPLAGDYE